MARDANFEVSIGQHRFDPAETASLRRRRGDVRPDDAPDPNETRIVQFERQLTGPDVDRLRDEYGLALTAYVPNLAYVERVDAATRRRLARDDLVRAIAAYRPEYKLDQLVVDQREAGAIGEVPLVASLFDGGSLELVEQELADAGASDIETIDQRPYGGWPLVTFTAPDEGILDVACALPDVRWIELAPRIKDDDVEASAVIQSGSHDNTVVWDQGIHGEDQIIGMLEGRTPDIGHCFIDDAPNNTARAAHRKVVSLRNANTGNHATFVAGCAVGDERGNSGNHANRGSAWAARLAAGGVNFNNVLTELTNNMNAGAFIHTNSWHDNRHGAGNPAPYNMIAVQVDQFCRNNEEHVVLGSSGNNGEEQGPPGTAKNALCVSAADAGGTDVDDGNPGPTADGRQKPDIVAVGCSIESSTGNACFVGTFPGNSGCATSWATPHAAGAAALVRQYFMEGFWVAGRRDLANGITPSGALIRAVLVNAAVNMAGEAVYPSNTQGFGILRLDRGLTFPSNGRNLVARDVRNQFGLRTGEDFTQAYNVNQPQQQLRVVLAYSDPPATAGATANTLVNNLNLEVTDPTGVKYVGNDFNNGFSRADSGNGGDTVNNLELVLVNQPTVGVWEIKVVGTSVTVDRQGFAIAATATNAPIESSSCFVATAVYGDAEHADVMALRRWRGRHLHAPGVRGRSMRVFASAYATVGPGAADVVRRHPRLGSLLRRRVFPPLVRTLTVGDGRCR